MHAAEEPVSLERPKRIVVKFKTPLAQEVENALPPSLDLDAPERAVRPAWFQQHGVKKLSPVYRELVRQKKNKSATSQQIADDVSRKFSRRNGRRPAGAVTPDVSSTYVLELSAASDLDLELAAARLNADPEVEYAQREQVAQTQLTPNDPYFATTGSWGQSYADMWGLYRIQASTAWDVGSGVGVIVAVVDTGIDPAHPELAANMWTNAAEIPGNGVDDDQNGFVDDVNGWDFVGATYVNPIPDNNPADVHGHGTHVAGTIGAVGNNGVGIVGVAYGARVMAVRGLDNGGTGSDVVLANAVVYAANNGADVINNSYGGQGFSQVLLDAVNYAHSLGAVVVVSAGNSSMRAETFFPASSPNAITVSATTPNDGRSSYSNFGGKIDVAAPGDDILSLRGVGTSRGSLVGTDYTRLSGTSMAAPHVSGLAALILAQQPAFSAEQVRQALRISATDLFLPGFDLYFGWGRINATAALGVSDPLEAKIQSPMEGQLVNGSVSFTGIAQGPGFSSYQLAYGTTETPSSWTVIQQSTASVNGGPLGTAELSLPDGRHSIRLQAFDSSGRIFSDRMTINVQYSQITSPRTPPVPSASQMFKPGVLVTLQGTLRGPSFTGYRVEWARGLNATSGWSTNGIILTNGGASPVTNGTFATFSTTGLTEADYYTVRALVDNVGFTSEVRTTIYVQPDLVSANWPHFMLSTPAGWYGNWSSMVPARDAAGNVRLFLSVGPDAVNPGQAKLLSFSPDGSASTSVLLQSAFAGFQPAAANLDGGPGDEIIVGDGGSVRVVRPDLTSYALTPTQAVTFKNNRVVVDDLNNDGSSEIIAFGNGNNSTAYLYAWRPDGQPLTANFPIQLGDANSALRDQAPGRFLTVDLNGDGLKEILVADGPTSITCNLRAFNWDGTPYTWPSLPFLHRISNMVAGDMDNDGSMDVVVAYFNNFSQEFWTVLSADGTVKPGWPRTEPFLAAGSRLALADLNRDGSLQLIVASGFHKISVFNSDGTSFGPAWPLQGLNPCCIAVVDVDGDGFPEIVSLRVDWINVPGGTSYDDFKLAAYRRDGALIRFWRMTGRDGLGSTRDFMPILGDFRQTGALDIAAWNRLDSYGFGHSLVLSPPGVAFNATTAPWPMAYRDAGNTCVVPLANANAPRVRITSPTDGTVLSLTVTLAATASDDVAVTGVQFKLNGVALGAELTAAPYTAAWDTREVANGVHTLTAIARDADGRTATSAITVVVDNDLVAPSVSITAPADGATVAGTISLGATATDNIGVVGVQFQLDGADLGAEDTAAPYAISWNTLSAANGSHTLRAIARDAAGNQTTATIAVTVNNDLAPPSVTLTAPADGSTVVGTINIAATATDNVGVVGVQFQLDGTNLGAEIATSPYAISWNTLTAANGAHTLSAIARDAAGNQATSSVTVTVNNDVTAPTVAVTAPANGNTVAGTISVTANATDNVGVVGVQFELDGANLGAEIAASPYAFSWNTLAAANGAHTLRAIARDAAGNQTISTAITVTVDNDLTAPTVSLTAPANGSTVAGTINVNASAADNIGVVGVQFQLDGVNLGGEDTVAPYTVAWNTITFTNTTHVLTAVARDAAGNTKTSDAVTVTVRNIIKINFQPSSAPTYSDYAVDSGATYGLRANGYDYGWNLNNASHAFDRNSQRSQDQRYDTLITMQTGGTYSWEIGVPNGQYSVHVVAGDATAVNSAYRINVEGVLTVNGNPTNQSRWKEGTSTVTVSDGRLTVSNGAGANNNKICFLEITPVP